MATPSVGKYATGGPVCTGRTGASGDYCSGSLRAKAIDQELAAGYMIFSGIRYYSIYPVITWAEYPTGIVDIAMSGGYPTSSAPSAIYNSYINDWIFWKPQHYHPGDPMHGLELRYFCELYSTSTRKVVWMSTGSGTDWGTQGLEPHNPAGNFDLSVSFEMNIDVNCHERVQITQSSGSGGEWTWPEDCFKDGMGKTAAVFDMKADSTHAVIKINGESITLPSGYIPSYSFTSARSVYGIAGTYSSSMVKWGWGQIDDYTSSYTFTGNAIFDSLTRVASMSMGTKECDLRLGYDENYAAITYTGTQSNSHSQGLGRDSLITYSVTHSVSSTTVQAYTKASWSNLGISYQYDIDFAMMDGDPDKYDAVPYFKDIASGMQWSGNTSGLIVFSGSWTLEMRGLDGAYMSGYSPETDHSAGLGAYWSRSEPAPSYTGVKFLNPEAFNDTADVVNNDLTGLNENLDDYRCQIVFPTQKTVVSWTLNPEIQMDAMDSKSETSQGAGGWTGVGCTLEVIDNKLVITEVTQGAYVFRGDFNHSSIYDGKHWPAHRFVRIYADCMDANNVPVDYKLILTVKRSSTGIDTMTKSFNSFLYWHPLGDDLPDELTNDSWIAKYDICNPIGSGGIDTSNSYIDDALPLNTRWLSGERQDGEYAHLSYSWGVGCFDRIEISGFTEGNTYRLMDLSTVYDDAYVPVTDRTHFGNCLYIQQECNSKRYAGDTVLNEDEEDNWSNYLWRHGIFNVNGRITAEFPSVMMSMSPHYAIDNYSNFSVKDIFTNGVLYPNDDYKCYTFTVTPDYVDCWDETNQEYTKSDLLWAADTCPIWFLLSQRDGGVDHDNVHDSIIVGAPLYDTVALTPWYGTGVEEEVRPGACTIKAIKRVRSRAHGIIWNTHALPTNPAYYTLSAVSSANEEKELLTDSFGYYRTGDHMKPVTITYNDQEISLSVSNRQWYRVCIDVKLQDSNIDLLNFGDINEVYYSDDETKQLSVTGLKLDNTQLYKYIVDQDLLMDNVSVQLRKSRYHNENVVRDIICHNSANDCLTFVANYGPADSQEAWDSTSKIKYDIPNTDGFDKPSIAFSAAYNTIYVSAIKDETLYYMWCLADKVNDPTQWSVPDTIIDGLDTQYASLMFDDRAGRLFCVFYSNGKYQVYVAHNGWNPFAQIALEDHDYDIIRNFANGQYMGVGPKEADTDATSEYFATFDSTSTTFSSDLAIKNRHMGIVADSDDIKRIAYFDQDNLPKVGYLNSGTTTTTNS